MAGPDFPPIQVAGTGQLYARLHTTSGNIVVHLEEQKTPRTVANFCGLATGTIDWKDPKSGAGMAGQSLYEGVRFHRVISGFMVQVGDPTSRHADMANRWGTGGPGYRFEDEIVADLKHDSPGVLSMANAGPGTNGSQFFITEGRTPHLDGRHTVFGHVVAGQDVVHAIATCATGPGDRPKEDQHINKVELFRSESQPAA